MAETKFGSFDELLEITEPALRPIVNQLRKLILQIDPKAVEVVRLGDRAATFGVGPKKMSEGYVYVLPHKSWVNLGFYKGALLSSKSDLMEGTGKSLRHIKIRSLADSKKAEIKTLIKLAVEERKNHFNLS